MESWWWEKVTLGDFGRFSLSGPLNPPNHNENLFRTYELLMLADIHVGFRPFLKNIFPTEVRSRGHFSSPSEAIPYQYTEGLKCYSKNRPKIKKFHWRQNRFRSQRVFIQKLWSNNEKGSTLVTLNDSKLGLDSFSLTEMIFDTFLGGVENILLTT